MNQADDIVREVFIKNDVRAGSTFTHEACIAVMRHAIEIATRRAVAHGWTLVPNEPTFEMARAAIHLDPKSDLDAKYRAMIAAAPNPPINHNGVSSMNHAAAINIFAAHAHAEARRNGWYHDPETGKLIDINVGEQLGLIHTEISEATQGHRSNAMDKHLPHRRAVEVELADAVIRIGNLATHLGLDLGGAVDEKIAYNAVREDHKPENRIKAGGKSF